MNQRSIEIDINKGILTVLMVLAHTIQFLSNDRSFIFNEISTYTNLVTFSGFYFCFGYAIWAAYLSKDRIPWLSVYKTSIKCYVAFVISGVSNEFLVAGNKLTMELFLKVVSLRIIPGYSEFLISFAFVIVLSTILSSVVFFVTKKIAYLSLMILCCLSLTFLPKYYHYDPVVGVLIGGSGFAYFPVLQYMPLFLLGIYFCRHQVCYNYIMMIISGLVVLLFGVLLKLDHGFSRFPPSAVWVISSMAMVYLYYGFAIFVNKRAYFLVRVYLNSVGHNVLFYLLTSNLVLFAGFSLGYHRALNSFQVILIYSLIMLIMLFMQYILIDLSVANKTLHRSR